MAKANGASAPTQSAPMDYDGAVTEAKGIIASADTNQWRLAELANLVETAYGEKKLATFAKAIGTAPCTVARLRSVWRAWHSDEIKGPAPESFAIAQALQGHPNRAELVKQYPDLTRGKARQLMAEYDKNAPRTLGSLFTDASGQPITYTADAEKPERFTVAYWQGQFILQANKLADKAQKAHGDAKGLSKWLDNPKNAATDLMETAFREVAEVFRAAATEWEQAAYLCAKRLKEPQDTPLDSCDAPPPAKPNGAVVDA